MQVFAGYNPIDSTSGNSLPDKILYLPKGKSQISATLGGEPKALRVDVNESVAATLQNSLKARLKGSVRPHFDFDHAGKGAASALPQSFSWDPDKGVMASVEWTGAGKTALSAKDYSYFSPTFLIDKKGVPTGLPKSGAIGALVNEPAFREIGKIAANHTTKTMDIDLSSFVQAGILTAAEAANPQTALPIVLAKFEDQSKLLKAASTARDSALAEIKDNNEKAADATIARLVKAGKVKEADKATVKKVILNDPDAVKLFEGAQSATPDVTQPVLPNGGPKPGEGEANEAKAAQVLEAANAIVASEKVPFSVAWGRAQCAAG